MRCSTCVLLVAILWAGNSIAEDGVYKDEIVVGESAALSGPAQDLGIGMSAGLQAGFEKINAEGGIHGRKIRLIVKDDQYEPQKAVAKTRELIETDKVFALIGECGTPTSQAVLSMVEESKIPFLAPLTGAEILRNPVRKYVFNIRAGYKEETERLAAHLVDKLNMSKIACFYQNDAFGQAGLKGITEALKKRNLELVCTGAYERNTIAVKSGLLKIRTGNPDAIVMIGTAKPLAEFVKLAKTVGMKNVIFATVSFVGAETFLATAGESGDGCYIAQVFNNPEDESVPVVKEFRAAMKEYQPSGPVNYRSLEGYVAARFLGIALKSLKGEPTRESLVAAIEELRTFDISGLTIEFSPASHQGLNDVWLTTIQQGAIKSVPE